MARRKAWMASLPVVALALAACDPGKFMEGVMSGDSTRMGQGMMPAAYTPLPYRIDDVPTGTWVEYESGQEQPGQPKGKYTVAVVKQEGADRWVEQRFGSGNDRMVMAYRVKPNREVVKAYMGSAGQEGIELRIEPWPKGMAPQGKPQSDPDYEVQTGKPVSETVSVPAGTFKSTRIATTVVNKKTGEKTVSNTWLSKEVPLGVMGEDQSGYGSVIKSEVDGKQVLALSGRGKDAQPTLVLPSGK